MSLIRHTVRFTGRVQGVGFRYTACRVARGHDVTGYVQNLHDGSVKLVAEGSPDELDAFLGGVGEAMRNNIASANVQSSAATGEFTAFDVRH